MTFPNTLSPDISQCQCKLLRQGHQNRSSIYMWNAQRNIWHERNLRSMSYIKSAEYLMIPWSWQLCAVIVSKHLEWNLRLLFIQKHMCVNVCVCIYVYKHVLVCILGDPYHRFFDVNLRENLYQQSHKSLTVFMFFTDLEPENCLKKKCQDADIYMFRKLYQPW